LRLIEERFQVAYKEYADKLAKGTPPPQPHCCRLSSEVEKKLLEHERATRPEQEQVTRPARLLREMARNPLWRGIGAVVIVTLIIVSGIGLFRFVSSVKPTPTALPTPSLTIDSLRDGALVDYHETIQAHCTGAKRMAFVGSHTQTGWEFFTSTALQMLQLLTARVH